MAANSYDPHELAALCRAFDDAWSSLEVVTPQRKRDEVREKLSGAILALAKVGVRNPKQLAVYGALAGQSHLDLRG